MARQASFRRRRSAAAESAADPEVGRFVAGQRQWKGLHPSLAKSARHACRRGILFNAIASLTVQTSRCLAALALVAALPVAFAAGTMLAITARWGGSTKVAFTDGHVVRSEGGYIETGYEVTGHVTDAGIRPGPA